MRMGDMGPRGAINMGGRDLKQKALVVLKTSLRLYHLLMSILC